jgi:hypothetical protein
VCATAQRRPAEDITVTPTEATGAAIQTHKLSKRYGDTVALDALERVSATTCNAS